MNLSKAAKVTRVSNAVAAGQTTINSSSVDSQGFDACQFTVLFGAITSGAATSIKAQGSSDDSAWSDLEDSAQPVADTADNQAFVIDVTFPQYRYLRAVVSRATQDSVVDGIVAQQYLADVEPVTHDSTTVGGSELLPAAGAGTA